MTSTEFSARYRLLKCIAERGARTFLAQQTELGRMVMVHYLDGGTADEQQRLRAALDGLGAGARQKLLDTLEVDGVPIVVSSFIPSFQDLPTWLAENGAPATSAPPAMAPDVTEAPTVIIEAVPRPATLTTPPPIAAPVVAPRAALPMERPPAASAPGEFTRVFGSISAVSAETPLRPTAPSPVVAAAAPPPASVPPSQVPSPAPGEFTQLFQKVSAPSSTASAPSAPPAGFSAPSPALASAPVTPLPPLAPPVAPGAVPPLQPPGASGPVPPLVSPPALLSLGAAPPALTPPPLPVLPPAAPAPAASGVAPSIADLPRALELTPRADLPASFAPPPAAALPPIPMPRSQAAPASGPGPISGVGLPPLPSAAPARPAWNAPVAPMPPAPSALAGPSEFTRILGKVTPGAPQPARMATPGVPMPLSATPQSSGTPAVGGGAQKKSLLPLIIALNVVLIATIGVVVYFALHRT